MVLLIHADNPGPYTGAGNNTWLLDGAEPTLVDAGTGLATHVERVRRALGGRPLRRVVVTHGHGDHASGVPALRAAWPEVEVRKFLMPEEAGFEALVPGDSIAAGDRLLQVVHTPGHAPDHVCLWDVGRRELFAGDMLIRPGTVLIPAGRGGNLRHYLASLAAIARLDPTRIYPGHGPIIDNPREVVAEYLEQRRRREEQVVEAVAAGDTDAATIVGRLYPRLEGGLERAATMTIQAHLDKLREEGRLP